MELGDWSFDATPHGLEFVRFRGVRVATRIFFSVRDALWASPRVTFSYNGTATYNGTAMTGSVEGYPLDISAQALLVDDALRLEFTVRATTAVDVTRAGPCILSERSDLAPAFRADGAEVVLSDSIEIERIASGFTALNLTVDPLEVQIAFEGERFELEDQRNWADATFKAYCPPLKDPQPIHFAAGESRSYAITLSATGTLPSRGLLHPGGTVPQLATRPDYLHLLVDLDSPTWRDDLEAGLAPGIDAVLTVDVPPGADLAGLAALAEGRVDTVLLFDRRKPTTSRELAATKAFERTGIRLGGGTRANFASLNAVRFVPAELEVVAVPLAVASHDDDDRALESSLGSFDAIVRDTRRIAEGRELLVGPVSFTPTFDSWGPADRVWDPRDDWSSRSERDGTEFARRWRVRAFETLAALDVARVTLGNTLDGR